MVALQKSKDRKKAPGKKCMQMDKWAERSMNLASKAVGNAGVGIGPRRINTKNNIECK